MATYDPTDSSAYHYDPNAMPAAPPGQQGQPGPKQFPYTPNWSMGLSNMANALVTPNQNRGGITPLAQGLNFMRGIPNPGPTPGGASAGGPMAQGNTPPNPTMSALFTQPPQGPFQG